MPLCVGGGSNKYGWKFVSSVLGRDTQQCPLPSTFVYTCHHAPEVVESPSHPALPEEAWAKHLGALGHGAPRPGRPPALGWCPKPGF